MLDRIRNELEKRKANNQGLIKSVRDSLNEYESKLNDLRESLREAKEQTKLAENLNGENERLLEEIKVNLSNCLSAYLSRLVDLYACCIKWGKFHNLGEIWQKPLQMLIHL